jgi:hypothetical protein
MTLLKSIFCPSVVSNDSDPRQDWLRSIYNSFLTMHQALLGRCWSVGGWRTTKTTRLKKKNRPKFRLTEGTDSSEISVPEKLVPGTVEARVLTTCCRHRVPLHRFSLKISLRTKHVKPTGTGIPTASSFPDLQSAELFVFMDSQVYTTMFLVIFISFSILFF